MLFASSYVISMGVAKAMGESLSIYKEKLTKIVLNRNNLTDDMLAQILKGLSSRKDVKSIIIVNNCFGEKSS